MTATATGRDLAYRGFRLAVDARLGTGVGVGSHAGGLELTDPVDRRTHDGATYEVGTWTSPPVPAGFAVAEVVPSWTARTPPGCWVEVQLRGWHADAPTTGWYTLARWAEGEEPVRRTSAPGQRDPDARVETDTLVVGEATVTGWQVRVTLLRPVGATTGPVLRTVGAVASGPTTDPADQPAVAVSGARGVVLAVPRYSQRRHAGGESRWGGGGDSWCSPTCMSMVLAFWGAGPPPARYAWVEPPGPRPVVVHAARHCYDHAYAGAGNWAFNTAYAGLHEVEAFVTRLRSLAEAEAFVAAGVPLVVSAAFRAGQVPGLNYDTRGHLMVLVGFTEAGDPVLNDPYAPDDESVRRIVDRARFEAAWQDGSGGATYVVHPASVPLPAPPAQPNW
ncbi:Peptidase_C39 like family protein [Micromonospora purpureochromogenes]|uniref:Peptidase_C39 like family protein n=1 Tax=Micromonospora purpureochromogenes TaxID=47872 RepID=A0A1C4ZX17_9ACTN|nr:peptidase C39 family protein [Micromonospora purpureochromogenes]SCF37522.1 Peptidase_C39 like family protein [Micromonospora purpureochromogenes]